MASQAAGLAAAEESRTRFAEIVARVAAAVAQELALPKLVDVVLDQTVSTLGACFAYAHSADEPAGQLDLLGQRNVPSDVIDRISRARFDAPLEASRAAARRRPLMGSPEALEPCWAVTRALLSRASCQSFVALPLVARERLVGVLSFALPDRHGFGPDERWALSACAEIFAHGIANAARYEDECRLRAELERERARTRGHLSALEEQQRDREEWGSIVAHDLRQPLNVITSYVALIPKLARTGDGERLEPALEQLHKAAWRLDRMIGDLADASRIVAGRLVIERRRSDLGALVREVVDRLRALVSRRPLRFECGAAVWMDVDPVRIEEALENLVRNALEHGGAETPVEVAVVCGPREATVTVSNAGPVIPPDEIPRLFRRYHRVPSPLGGSPHGLGLGLYIARGVVEAHGGRIWAESEPGRTAFRFALPLS